MMRQYVVAVSIDKVQTFIYHVLQAYIQENQVNSGTLSEIVNSSNLISKKFYLDIGIKGGDGEFSGHIDDQLLVCSGMCVFTTSLDEKMITEKLDRLFRKYYESFKGNLLVKSVFFEMKVATNKNKMDAIKKSKKRLRQQECLNHTIARHQDLLFQFCNIPDEPETLIALDKEYPFFSSNINALYSQEEADNDNHFRIAVIKADLDGVGTLFEGLREYAVYQAISDLLSRFISLDYLHEKAGEYQQKGNGFKLYPLYMAGDDIFFVVPVAQLLNGVNLCKDILRELNKEVTEISEQYSSDLQKFSMSVGIDVTFNREPIRYYYERVQRQVECAKIYNSNMMKISINGYVFIDYDVNKEKSQWAYFQDDIRLLKGAMQEGFAVHHFLYGLLSKISDTTIGSSDLKYSNAVINHLRPSYLGSGNKKLKEFEFLIIERLLKRLLDTKENSSGKKNPEKELCFGSVQRKRLERYVRLLLLFSDPRFAIAGGKVGIDTFGFDSKRVRSILFNKTRRYMYEKSLHSLLKEKSTSASDIKKLRDIFIKSDKYHVAHKFSTQGYQGVQVYRTLQISNSMFQRFKKMDKKRIDTVVDMLHSVNNRTKEEVKKLEADRKSQSKAPPGLFFDKEHFCSINSQINIWTNDYIDTLFIFYRLNELSIQYRILYPNKKYNGTREVRK